ncbi:MAG: DUF5028 domain-containing protein [Eggerthellaceae bacterium]
MIHGARKSILVGAVFVVFIILVGVGLKIYSVNANALVVLKESYFMGTNVDLDGSYVQKISENTQGYSWRVNSIEKVSYNDYVKRFALPSMVVDGRDAPSIILLEVTIRNEGNTDGYLNAMMYYLIPKRANTYFIIDSSLWQLAEPNAPSDIGALTLVPDTEYTTYIPYVANISEEKAYTQAIPDTSFDLRISNGPVSKSIELII